MKKKTTTKTKAKKTTSSNKEKSCGKCEIRKPKKTFWQKIVSWFVK